MLMVKEKFKEPPREMVVWDVIKDISPLKKWGGDIYNGKDL
jgi:hypothetical protein